MESNTPVAQASPSEGRTTRMLPFFVEFVKFSAGFAVIIAVALITLRFASAAV